MLSSISANPSEALSLSPLGDLNRLLIVRLDNIGDMVMLSPAIRSLRAAYPRAEITLLTSKAGARVSPLLPWSDRTLRRRVLWQDASAALDFDPQREQKLIADLTALRFDAAFIFTSFSQSVYPPAYACYLAGIPVRIGQSDQFGGGVLSHPIPSLPHGAHQVDRNLHLLRGVGILPRYSRPCISIPLSALASAEATLKQLKLSPGKFIAVAPGASCSSRRYSMRKMASVCRLLVENSDSAVLVLGTEEEAKYQPLFAPPSRFAPLFTLFGRTSVPEFAAFLSYARLILCNNSSALHFADALGVPPVIMFSGTDLPGEWLPKNVPYRLLHQEVSCCPCRHFECPYDHQCLDFEPEQVCAEVSALLQLSSENFRPSPAPEIQQEAPCVH